jgi:hypothetical protein
MQELNLHGLDPGFTWDHLVTFTIDPSIAHYTPPQRMILLERLKQRMTQLSDVQSVAVASRGVLRGRGFGMTVGLPWTGADTSGLCERERSRRHSGIL